MKIRNVVSTLALAALAAPAFAIDKAAIIEHIRESYPNIPASLEMSLGDPKPSEVPGFDVAELTISHQSEKLYISKDGRYYVLGGFKDLKSSPDKERMAKMALSGAPIRGNKKAKIQVVEYTDFQCPYCEIGYQVMRNQIMKQYGDKIQWIYKSLPLKEIHPWAETAAIGAECAHKQGEAKFWNMHDAIFEHQKEINVRNVDDKLAEYAKSEGLDSDKFKACYLGKETAQNVDKDLSEAGQLGINGTPAFLVNGRLISGADGESIKQLIEASLKKSEKS